MRVSVIIPTLNEEKYIEYTLFHVKKQHPFEIIVADSHSKDDTVKIAKQYGARVTFAERKNAAVGRNAGAKISRGDVLVFLDADSIAYPNLLETIRNDFRDKKLACWTCKVYAFSPSWKEHIFYDAFNRAVQASAKIKKPKAAGLIIAVRKGVFEKISGFNEKINVLEDFDFCSRTKNLGRFKFSTETCVYTSTRRTRKWGVWGSIKKYIWIYIKTIKGDYTSSYRRIR